ncbi:purine nucleoside phosphorylase [Clostridium sp. CAG:508]|jgi:purine-nucleoside phosphorylase|nr:purine nucleoside phosphorylase [Clostridium sp. CAG:508]
MPIHCNAKKEDIAKTVLMPGDPLRAKYIAENFLENARLVNTVRNMLAYTGTYKGKEITVFSHGMGMASMGIYCYELYKFYDVENIIRIGSCGAYSEDLNIFDTILVDKSYTEGNFAYEWNEKDCHLIESSEFLNEIIESTAKEINIPYIKGNTLCSDCFDGYLESIPNLIKRFPKELNIIGAEMEAFALFYMAHYLCRQASCLLTVVDSHYKKQEISSEEREKSLNNMITLALESAIKIENAKG